MGGRGQGRGRGRGSDRGSDRGRGRGRGSDSSSKGAPRPAKRVRTSAPAPGGKGGNGGRGAGQGRGADTGAGGSDAPAPGEKSCSRCGNTKPAADFINPSSGKQGKTCAACVTRDAVKRAADRSAPPPKRATRKTPAAQKDLVKPKEQSPLANQDKRRREKTGFQAPRTCHGCNTKLQRENFTDEQWDKKVGPGSDQKRSCKDCEAKGGVPEAREVRVPIPVPIREDASYAEDMSPLEMPNDATATCRVFAYVTVPREPEANQMERASAQLKCTRPLNGKIEGETLNYSVQVYIQYDEQGQPFTLLDRVTRALVDSAYGTMNYNDVIATREDRWLKDLKFDKEKAFKLVLALAEDDHDYVEEAKRAASSAAWKLNPRRHRSGAPSRRRYDTLSVDFYTGGAGSRTRTRRTTTSTTTLSRGNRDR